MQKTIHLPCTASDLESAVLTAAQAGYWDSARVYGHYDPETGKHSIIIHYGEEKKHEHKESRQARR